MTCACVCVASRCSLCCNMLLQFVCKYDTFGCGEILPPLVDYSNLTDSLWFDKVVWTRK